MVWLGAETFSDRAKLLLPRGAEAGFAAVAGRKGGRRNQFTLWQAQEKHLGNAVAAANLKGLGTMIDEDGLDFAAVAGVDGSRRIKHCYAALERQPAARPHVCHVVRRQFNVHASWYGRVCAGSQREVASGA